jgi:KaiC/GvpD/RAD55 family RecA-like ATPase
MKIIFINTGDKELNHLLAVEEGEDKGGMPIGVESRNPPYETTVILIEGGAGIGKTTLALQIAANAAKLSGCAVPFLSLEQPASSLRNTARNFNFPTEVFKIPKDMSNEPTKGRVSLCRLSPLPISPISEEKKDDVFKTRFAELENIVTKLARSSSCPQTKKLFILDSLNAFTGSPLTRSQTYQIFTLFRSKHVPAIVTLEQPESFVSPGVPLVETESFLADVVVKLSRELRQDYLQFFLEVSKSRVCLQGLGKHLFKTRTAANPEQIGLHGIPRTGVVVYPSVHFVVARTRKKFQQTSKGVFQVADELAMVKWRANLATKKEKTEELLEKKIHRPACFAVMGPAGTHKLALGLNLSLGYVDSKARLLVITFGGQGDIDFKGVAWTQSQQYLRKLKKIEPHSVENDRGGRSHKNTKTHVAEYEVKSKPPNKRFASVTVLTFYIGVLTPEECIYSIEQVLKDAEEKNNAYNSVLLSDTAELCTGFPLLSKDPIFFAALLDLFESRGLVTVGIGVAAADQPSLREINLTLMAKASHRLVLRHFPDVEKLMSDKIQPNPDVKSQEESKGAGALALNEQLVSVVIDNVTGKHYRRQPKWVSVKEATEEGQPKELCFNVFEEPPLPAPMPKPAGKRSASGVDKL